jgi:hypothetical protein
MPAEGDPMSKSKGLSRVKTDVSDSLNKRLSAYALAAGAAGISLLSASTAAEARVIHEQINFPLYGNQTYDFNPAHQSGTPFFFVGTFLFFSSLTFWNRAFFQPNSAGASAVLSAGGLPAELAGGSVIGPRDNWGKGASYGMLFTYGPYGGGTQSHHRGNFGKPGFVGFRFTVSGKQHYGWVRLRFSIHLGPSGTKQTTTEIVDCAFETTPGKSIRAGQTKESPDQVSNLTPYQGNTPHSRAASLVSRRPASLGMLAVGASGIPLWRMSD